MPDPIYLLLRNMTYITIAECASVTLDDAGNVIEVYDLETFRNLIPSGDIGRAWNTANVTYPVKTGISPPHTFDDRHKDEDRRLLLKKRAKAILWSGVLGRGDKIAMAWLDQIIGYSGGIPQFVGSGPISAT